MLRPISTGAEHKATWSTEFTQTSRVRRAFGWMTSPTELHSIDCADSKFGGQK